MSDLPLPADELKRLLEADRQRRMQAVQAAIAAALTEHGCELRAAPLILEDGRIGANIVIVPL